MTERSYYFEMGRGRFASRYACVGESGMQEMVERNGWTLTAKGDDFIVDQEPELHRMFVLCR